MNITIDELRSWCPECATTLSIVAPGWAVCAKCGWEQLRRGQSLVADAEIAKRTTDEVRECFAEDTLSDLKIPYKKGKGGGRSGRFRGCKKKWWRPWYVRD